jgi:apolipoprotein N-acyltransferase
MPGWSFLVRFGARRPFLAAALLGLVSAAALPPVHAVPVLLLCLPGLLWLIGKRRDWRGAAAIGFWFGLGHHVAGLYWITDAILVEAARFWWLVPLAVPTLAALLAIFLVLPCAVARLVPAGWPRVLVLAGGWVLADLARQFVLSGFPWNPFGSVWAVPGPIGDVMLQPAALAGVHGLTLVTLLLASLPALGRRAMAGGAVMLAAWVGFGAWRLSQPADPTPPVAVVLVQGNIAQDGKWERSRALRIFEQYLALTRAGVAAARRDLPGVAPVVVWPETASPFLVASDPDARAAIAEAAGVPALIGALRFDAAQRPRNSLVVVDGPGPAPLVYDKWHLVPFGEYQPGWFPLPIALVSGDGFARGDGPATLRLPGLPGFGPLICYEAIFPGQIVAADRPDWLVNVTNDAWFGNSTGPRQHLAAARLRAIEEGLPLMRAANTGITAGFDAHGRELGRIGMNVTATIVLALPGKLSPPLFARLGLVLPAGLAGAAMGIGLMLGRSG